MQIQNWSQQAPQAAYLSFRPSASLLEQLKELNVRVNSEGAEGGFQGEEAEAVQAELYQLYYILNRVLSYPLTALAEIHRDSNRLGVWDLDCSGKIGADEHRQIKIKIRKTDKKQPISEFSHFDAQLCNCCGFMYQPEQLSTCAHSVSDIGNIGIQTYMLFRTIINVIVLLAVMLIVYSLYALISNIYASTLLTADVQSTFLSVLTVSISSKQRSDLIQKSFLFTMEVWLGCGMVLVWSITFLAFKYLQKEQSMLAETLSKSAADYSIAVQGMPTGISLEEMQRHFDEYLQRINSNQGTDFERVKIVKYNQGKPFYFNESEFNCEQFKTILQHARAAKEMFIEWILHRRKHSSFLPHKMFRDKKYADYEQILQQKHERCLSIVEMIKSQFKKDNKANTTTVFITFESNHQKNLLLSYNSRTIWGRLKSLFLFGDKDKRFSIATREIVLQQQQGVNSKETHKEHVCYPRFYPAPEPEDVIWSNVGVSSRQSIFRRLITYSATLCLLIISFVIVYTLSSVKLNSKLPLTISLIISLAISGINLLIGVVIQLLTRYERDYTVTNYQISMALKSIIAQLINSIGIPIVANYFIRENIYGNEGLVYDVFVLSFTNALVPPIAKVIDLPYRCCQLYAKYMSRPKNKLYLNQYELNSIYEKLEFQVGFQYIYIVNLFIFTCFFVTLQPIIPFVAIGGLLAMYWAEKHALYEHSQRPVPGTEVIGTTMAQIIYFGPAAYSFGTLVWSSFLSSEIFVQTLIPHLVTMGLSVIIFVMPYEMIFEMVFKEEYLKTNPLHNYWDNRMYFTAEYDRLNPSTSEQGIKEYQSFIDHKRLELEKGSLEVQEKVSLELERKNRNNHHKSSQMFLPFQQDESNKMVMDLLLQQSKNTTNPLMMASLLLPAKNKSPFRPLITINEQVEQVKTQGKPKKRKIRTVQSLDIRKNVRAKSKRHQSRFISTDLAAYVRALNSISNIPFEESILMKQTNLEPIQQEKSDVQSEDPKKQQYSFFQSEPSEESSKVSIINVHHEELNINNVESYTIGRKRLRQPRRPLILENQIEINPPKPLHTFHQVMTNEFPFQSQPIVDDVSDFTRHHPSTINENQNEENGLILFSSIRLSNTYNRSTLNLDNLSNPYSSNAILLPLAIQVNKTSASLWEYNRKQPEEGFRKRKTSIFATRNPLNTSSIVGETEVSKIEKLQISGNVGEDQTVQFCQVTPGDNSDSPRSSNQSENEHPYARRIVISPKAPSSKQLDTLQTARFPPLQ